jgi:hypothetical protein
MHSWAATGSLWYQHFLHWCGVEAEQIQWLIGTLMCGRFPNLAATSSRM